MERMYSRITNSLYVDIYVEISSINIELGIILWCIISISMNHWKGFVAGCHYMQKSNPNLKYYRIPKKHIDYNNAFFETENIA